jgi:hypothetical protein
MITPNQWQDNADVNDATFLYRLLLWRDQELIDTDWTQVADSQVDKVAWATYRQGLRDLTKQNVVPRLIVIPERPV